MMLPYLSSVSLSHEELVEADLQNLTIEQAKFNKWFNEQFHFHGDEKFLDPPVKITRIKCIGWKLLPESILGAERQRFKGWHIGHCLNCDANPYDGTVEAWSYDANWYRGALIRCNKCGQLRWQSGENGRDY